MTKRCSNFKRMNNFNGRDGNGYQSLLFDGLPKEYKWAAMEKTGLWVAYPYKPILCEKNKDVGTWWHPENYIDKDGVRGEFYYEKNPPPHTDGWKNSLIERIEG